MMHSRIVFLVIGSAALLAGAARADGIRVVVGDATVPAGSIAEVAVSVHAAVPGTSVDVAGLELRLRWDPGALALEDVEVVGPLTTWIGAENVQRDHAHLAYADVYGLLATDDPIEILRLRFRTSPVPGISQVELTPVPARTRALEAIDMFVASGRIETGDEVRTEVAGFGAVKALYVGSDG